MITLEFVFALLNLALSCVMETSLETFQKVFIIITVLIWFLSLDAPYDLFTLYPAPTLERIARSIQFYITALTMSICPAWLTRFIHRSLDELRDINDHQEAWNENFEERFNMITAQLRNIGRSAQSRDQTLCEGLEERERILMAWIGVATGAIQRMQATQVNDTWALVNMANRLDALQESMVDITNPIANKVRRLAEQDLPNVLERLAAIDDDTGTIREWIEANKENFPVSPLTVAPRTRPQSAPPSSDSSRGWNRPWSPPPAWANDNLSVHRPSPPLSDYHGSNEDTDGRYSQERGREIEAELALVYPQDLPWDYPVNTNLAPEFHHGVWPEPIPWTHLIWTIETYMGVNYSISSYGPDHDRRWIAVHPEVRCAHIATSKRKAKMRAAQIDPWM